MSGTPIPGSPLCRTLSELRHACHTIPLNYRPSFVHRSSHALQRVTGPHLPIYFITSAPSDVLLVGHAYQKLLSTPRSFSGFSPLVLVVICSCRENTVDKVLHTLSLHTRQNIQETRINSRIWIAQVPTPSINGSSDSNVGSLGRMYFTLGDPDKSATGDATAYWDLVDRSMKRTANLVGQIAQAAQINRFMVVVATRPIMLFTMPGWFWNCVRAVVMVNSLSTTTSTIKTSISSEGGGGRRPGEEKWMLQPALAEALPHFERILAQAKSRFPILHVGFSYSSGGKIFTLHDFPGFVSTWPKLFHADVYSPMMKLGMDAIYTTLIRLAAAARGMSGETCAKKAVEGLKGYKGGKPWIQRAEDETSYPPENCTLESTLPFVGPLTAAVDCPVNDLATSLAALVLVDVQTLPATDILAARVAWRETGKKDGSVEVMLSGDSPQYILLALTPKAGERIDIAVKKAWGSLVSGVKERSGTEARITRPIAEGWRSFVMGTRGLMGMLVKDEEQRGNKQDVKEVKKRFSAGNMTEISKRSLA